MQAPAYYEHDRPEVRALVPASACFVIDVGCAAGALGRELKRERPGIQVRGFEPVEAAAAVARGVLDDVRVADASAPLPASWPAPDCVVFADVLEHLDDPWGVLRCWAGRLVEGGTVVASIPNVAHHTVVRALWRGRWDYADAGILDRTHLRFFTRETILELFDRAGLAPTRLERVVKYGRASRLARAVDRLGGGALRPGLTLSRLCDPWTIQFVVVARRNGPGRV